MATAEIQFPAASMRPLDDGAAFPQYDTADLGTVTIEFLGFDDGLAEITDLPAFKIPTDLDGSGTVTFRLYHSAATAAASKNTEYTLNYRPVGDTESLDGAYSTKASGDFAVTNTQEDVDIDTWTETVSNLGWVAHDLIQAQLQRTAPSANDLVGDDRVILFVVEIPLA